MSKNIWILNNFEELLTTLTGDGDAGGCRYWDGQFEEPLNPGETATYQFYADAKHPYSRHVVKDNKVVFKEPEEYGGEYRMFTIIETESSSQGEGKIIIATCEPAWYELADDFIENIRPTDKTPQQALDLILAGTRYVGEVDPDLQMIASDSFYQVHVKDAVIQFFNTWGGYFKDVIDFDGNNVTRRVIKSLKRRGAANGVRFENDRDITSIRRIVTGYPKTALYPYGASLEMTDEDGNTTGGYTRYIDIKDVVWSTAAGDPVDKPLGQAWVGDPELLNVFGRLMPDGTLRHRWERWQDEDIEKPEELIQAAYDALVNSVSKATVNYEVEVGPKNVKLGDTCIVLDRDFADPIELEADVIKMVYYTDRPEDGPTITLGEFLDVDDIVERQISDINNRFKKREGKWNTGGGISEVTDGAFPDTKPPTPANINVEALFQTIRISWDYDPASYIAGYRVYASKTQGFTPTENDIIFSGKVGGYEHKVGNNEVWYYRISAVNYKKTESDISAEFSAQSIRVMTDDILFGAITAEKLADLSITAEKLSVTFEGQNLLAGSMFRSFDDTYRLNTSNRYLDTSGEFNEMRVEKTRTDEPLFGITFTPRSKLNLRSGTAYTLSFELKRMTISDFDYLRIRVDGTEVYAIPNNLSDISSADPNTFVRYDIVFTPDVNITNGALWMGASTTNSADAGEFTIRKIQIREGNVRKDFTFSPYDTQLIDGAVTSAIIQDAAITSAKVAEAAIGTAAIQNAAIARAHLQEAIIDTVHIADAAITSAKIKDLSADKITSGTINSINITGSLIKGGKFQALNVNNNFDSYFDGEKLYQYKRSTASGTYAEYTSTEINSSLFYQESGKDYQDGSGKKVYRSVSISDGKVSVKGAGEYNNVNDLAVVEMYGDFTTYGYGAGKIVITNTTTANVPKDIFTLEGYRKGIDVNDQYNANFTNRAVITGSSTLLSLQPLNFEVVVGGGLRFKSTKRTVFEGAPAELPKKSIIMPGDDQFTSPAKIVGGNVTSLVTDIHGGLQNNLMICITQINVTLGASGGSYAYAYAHYNMVDGDYEGAENIFAVMATPYGTNANNVTVGVMNQSSAGFYVHVRGTGATDVAATTVTIRLAIFYEKL